MLFVVAVAIVPAIAQAQGAVEAWVQRYNGPGNGDDRSSALAVDGSGNVCVTGYSYGGDSRYEGSGTDYLTIKYSSTGVPLWTNCYNPPSNWYGVADAVAVDSNGSAVVTGSSEHGYVTIKYSSAGVPLWTNYYNGPGISSAAYALAVDGDDNVVVTGGSYGAGGNTDYLTIKYSSAGVPLWTNRYNGPANGNDFVAAMALDASGNVVVTGNSATIKYSSKGALMWAKTYSVEALKAVAVDASGNAFVTGSSSGIAGLMDYLTIKYSSAGVVLWTNGYNGPANDSDTATAVAVDASGNVFVTGWSAGVGTSADYVTFKYSSTGVPLWTNRYNGPANGGDGAAAVVVDPSGNVVVTGWSVGSGSGEDYATIAYSSAGLPLWTNRYNGPDNGNDEVFAAAVDSSGSVYVTGYSPGSGSGWDFATVKYVVPPMITRQPFSRTNTLGTTASFTVEAAGGLPLSYQWRRGGTDMVDGGNLSGVTSTNLLVANVQLADAAGYSVVVTNAYGSVTSVVAQLTVTIPPNPGRFTHLAYSPEAGFSFIFRDATVGRLYRIQRSTSLQPDSWTDWQSFTYSEPLFLTDMGATGQERRFYRAVSP